MNSLYEYGYKHPQQNTRKQNLAYKKDDISQQKWNLLQNESLVQHMKISQCKSPHNASQNYQMIISIDTDKAFEKI